MSLSDSEPENDYTEGFHRNPHPSPGLLALAPGQGSPRKRFIPEKTNARRPLLELDIPPSPAITSSVDYGLGFRRHSPTPQEKPLPPQSTVLAPESDDDREAPREIEEGEQSIVYETEPESPCMLDEETKEMIKILSEIRHTKTELVLLLADIREKTIKCYVEINQCVNDVESKLDNILKQVELCKKR